MLSPDEEESVLQCAIERGWLSRSAAPSSAISSGATDPSPPRKFGERIDLLIAAGVLSGQAIAVLIQECLPYKASGETASGAAIPDMTEARGPLESPPPSPVMAQDAGPAPPPSSANQQLTRTGTGMGTPAYMSPEQTRGDNRQIDRRTDVYSLGVILYELLTGHPPFAGSSSMDTAFQVMNEDPVPVRKLLPHIPVDLEVITMKCLEKDPGRRYESALALAQDLQAYLSGELIAARSPSLAYRAHRLVHRHKAASGLAALFLSALLVLGGVWLRSHRAAQAQAKELAEEAQLAEQIGQDVTAMELFLRVVYGLKLHDTQPERAAMQQRMRLIEERAQRSSLRRRGPTDYALGRGHLALREYGAAHERLQAAWNSGYRTPEVSYALGRALLELYAQKRADAERIEDDDRKQRSLQSLEAEYLQPARKLLSLAGESKLESARYAAGLLALYSGH